MTSRRAPRLVVDQTECLSVELFLSMSRVACMMGCMHERAATCGSGMRGEGMPQRYFEERQPVAL